MRDKNIYSENKIWSQTQAFCAEHILTDIIRKGHDLSNVDVLEKAARAMSCRLEDEDEPITLDLVHAVWNRLHTEYPHMFAVAQETGTLDTLNLDGTVINKDSAHHSISQISFKGWTVSLDDIQAYCISNEVRPSVFELLLRLLIPKVTTSTKAICVGNSFYLFQPDHKKRKIYDLFRKHSCVLLPHLDKESTSWCIVALTQTGTSTDLASIDIYHWHKHKRAGLDTLEQKLLKLFPLGSIRRKPFVFQENLSYIMESQNPQTENFQDEHTIAKFLEF